MRSTERHKRDEGQSQAAGGGATRLQKDNAERRRIETNVEGEAVVVRDTVPGGLGKGGCGSKERHEGQKDDIADHLHFVLQKECAFPLLDGDDSAESCRAQ